ncbi:MAG: hypothetical protein ACOCWQ_04405 [Nanoarchaeota archaeon]
MEQVEDSVNQVIMTLKSCYGDYLQIMRRFYTGEHVADDLVRLLHSWKYVLERDAEALVAMRDNSMLKNIDSKDPHTRAFWVELNHLVDLLMALTTIIDDEMQLVSGRNPKRMHTRMQKAFKKFDSRYERASTIFHHARVRWQQTGSGLDHEDNTPGMMALQMTLKGFVVLLRLMGTIRDHICRDEFLERRMTGSLYQR